MAFRYLAALLALALTLLAGPALAAPKDAVFNKEGVWGIDVDHGACVASMVVPDGSAFILRAMEGEINIGLFARSKIAKGKVGRIETDAGGFDFQPGWGENSIYTADVIGARGVATLRPARQVRILVDGRPVMDASVANTGFADAVDGVIACSKGQSGWWGKGVQTVEATAKPEVAKPEPALNKEGFWQVGADGGHCFASMKIIGGSNFLLSADAGQVTFAFRLAKPVAPGLKGEFQTEAWRFDFTPNYGGNSDVVFLADHMNDKALAALRVAKRARVVVDGEPLAGASLEDTGFEGALDALIACSNGETGWWGEGAKVEAAAAVAKSPAVNKENVWFLERSPAVAEVCTAFASANERTVVLFIGAAGAIGVAVKSDDDMRRGRKGLVEADSTSIAFKPVFDGGKYFSSDESFDESALAAVRSARALRISVDGRPVVDASIEGTGLPALLDDLAACSKGQQGWWGEGAKAR